MVEEYMFEPLMRRVVRSSVCVRLDCSDYLNRPLVFWKEILKRIFHSVQSSCPANRAIAYFYESLRPVKKRKKKRRGKDAPLMTDPTELCDEIAPLDKDVLKKTYWPTLKKDHHALLHKGIFYVFDTNVRFLKNPQRRSKESDGEERTTMNVSLSSLSSCDNKVEFRGWSLSICSSSSKEESKKMTLDDFASGEFTYKVEIPKSSSSIVIEFHHRKAPFMADSIPPRVRQLIPSVRQDEKNLGGSREELECLHVKCTFSP
eukprot:g211.t1